MGQSAWRQKHTGGGRRSGPHPGVLSGIPAAKAKSCKTFIGRDKIEDDDTHRVAQGDEETEEAPSVLALGMPRGLGWHPQRPTARWSGPSQLFQRAIPFSLLACTSQPGLSGDEV